MCFFCRGKVIYRLILNVYGREMDHRQEDVIQCRKLLLDSYSSQLTTHARLIIGFAIILLTLLQVKAGLTDLSHIQFGIIYFGIFLAAFALWFLFMRHLAYGLLVNAVTHARIEQSWNGDLLGKILDSVSSQMLKSKILYIIPSCWFYSSSRKRLLGLSLCVFLALLTTYFMRILME